jgi:DNA-binding CsgD family transcriptional regulator
MADPRTVTTPADPLTPDDYQRMFDVLDGVVGGESLDRFCGRLLGSLDHELGWSKAYVIEGPAPVPTAAEVPAPDHCFDTFGGTFMEEYVRHWRSDPLIADQAIAVWPDRRVLGLGQVPYRTPARRPFVERFLRRNGIMEILMCGSRLGGRMVSLGVGFRDRADAGPRERAIMFRLWPQLALHLNGLIASSGGGADWRLTARERLITELVTDGLTNTQIARRLHITIDTVKKHLTHAMAKTGCHSRTQLAVRWRQYQLRSDLVRPQV